MKALVIGGSRNIGYLAALRLLENGATVTFLLRNPSCFDANESIKPLVASGKARLVQGDALKEEDVRKVWNIASEGSDGPLDIVLYTVGGTPGFSLWRGFIITPDDLCTRSMLNLLSVYPHDIASQPKLVVVSSIGVGRTAFAALPFLLRILYFLVLPNALADKLGMERVIGYAAGWDWPTADGEPKKTILPDGWQERLGSSGWLKQVCVIRPPLLTNGECMGDKLADSSKAPYRAEDHELDGSYTISRKDVAHFIVTRILTEWEKWGWKCIRFGY